MGDEGVRSVAGGGCTEGDIAVLGGRLCRCEGGTWVPFEPDREVAPENVELE